MVLVDGIVLLLSDVVGDIERVIWCKVLDYIGLVFGMLIEGILIDCVFIGLCINVCIEDLCEVVWVVWGCKVVLGVWVMVVFGFGLVCD